jgi:hypothetical protein
VQTVTDEDGNSLIRLKRSDDASLVRDPETGAERYVPNDSLTDESDAPLATVASGVDPATRRAILACRDERSLGLLVELVDRGPTAVETILSATDLCESDLHGVLAEFRAGGLVAETTVAGRPGYEPTDDAERVVKRFRGDGD